MHAYHLEACLTQMKQQQYAIWNMREFVVASPCVAEHPYL
jgi:hypothetical protein